MNEAIKNKARVNVVAALIAILSFIVSVSAMAENSVVTSVLAQEEFKDIALTEKWQSRWNINETWRVPSLTSTSPAGRLREILLASPIASKIQGYACKQTKRLVVVYINHHAPVECQPLLTHLERGL